MKSKQHRDTCLNFTNKRLNLLYYPSTKGNSGYSISKLFKQTNKVFFDPGLINTAITSSSITYVNGTKGILQYRGYSIEDLAKYSNFLETSYLLIYNRLPTSKEFNNFDLNIRNNFNLPKYAKKFLENLPDNIHPIFMLSSYISTLSGVYGDNYSNITTIDQVESSIYRLFAQVFIFTSYIYRKLNGQSQFNEPVFFKNKSLIENFLYICFMDNPRVNISCSKLMQLMNIIFIVHADHEQSCSTTAVRLVGSTHASIFSSVIAGIHALSGPLHGGAGESVLKMLNYINSTGCSIKKYLNKIKDKKTNIKLMGFGHRLYKTYDPRAKIIKNLVYEIFNLFNINDSIFDIAIRLEKEVLKDEYFMKRKLYPNIDFYTGLLYKAMGFPEKMFSTLFVISRISGWIAQWKEMRDDKNSKLIRPKQIYIGYLQKKYPKK